MKNILSIAPFYPPDKGGAESFAKDISDFYCKNNFKVKLICFNSLNDNADKVNESNFNENYENKTIYRIKWFGKYLFDKIKIRYVLFLYIFPALFFTSLKVLLKNKNDISIIECHGLLASFCGLIFSKLFKIKYVCHVLAIYNFNDYFLKIIFKIILNNSKRVFIERGLSKYNLISLGIKKNLLIEYNQPVDLEMFYPLKTNLKNILKSKLNLNFDKNIIFVGRGIRIKGHDFYMNLCKKFPNIGFIMVTNKIEKDLFDDIEDFEKKNSNFFVFKDIDYLKLNQFYQCSDLICIPSNYEENSVRVLGEALSCGLPVISSDKGSLPFIVDISIGYYLPLELNSFVNKLNLILSDDEFLSSLSQNCINKACKDYTYKNFDKILLNL